MPSANPTRDASEYDVFLCHNSQDKDFVRTVADELIRGKLHPFMDEGGIQPGDRYYEIIDTQLKTARSVLVFVGLNGLGPVQMREILAIQEHFHRRGLEVAPVLLPDAPSNPDLPPFLTERHWIDFRNLDLRGPHPITQIFAFLSKVLGRQSVPVYTPTRDWTSRTNTLHGQVLNASGQPLRGARVSVTGMSMAGAALDCQLETDADGKYSIRTSPGNYKITASYQTKFQGKATTVPLHPVDGQDSSVDSRHGKEKNFTWLLSGLKPGCDPDNRFAYYGGVMHVRSVNADGYGNHGFEFTSAMYEIRLRPVGPLIDGSIGDEIRVTRTGAELNDRRSPDGHSCYLYDIPAGVYDVTAYRSGILFTVRLRMVQGRRRYLRTVRLTIQRLGLLGDTADLPIMSLIYLPLWMWILGALLAFALWMALEHSASTGDISQVLLPILAYVVRMALSSGP